MTGPADEPGLDTGPLDTGPLDTGPLDTMALRRRVLLTGVVTMVLFLAIGLVLSAGQLSAWWAVPIAVLLYAFVVRPMMAPVRTAIGLRRDLAYQAFREQRRG